MGLDGSQACINFCFGYSVFLEAHHRVIINSLECWPGHPDLLAGSGDTTLRKKVPGKQARFRAREERGESVLGPGGG